LVAPLDAAIALAQAAHHAAVADDLDLDMPASGISSSTIDGVAAEGERASERHRA